MREHQPSGGLVTGMSVPEILPVYAQAYVVVIHLGFGNSVLKDM